MPRRLFHIESVVGLPGHKYRERERETYKHTLSLINVEAFGNGDQTSTCQLLFIWASYLVAPLGSSRPLINQNALDCLDTKPGPLAAGLPRKRFVGHERVKWPVAMRPGWWPGRGWRGRASRRLRLERETKRTAVPFAGDTRVGSMKSWRKRNKVGPRVKRQRWGPVLQVSDETPA